MSDANHMAAFLELVERDRAHRCERLLADADARSRTVLQAARHDARARVTAALKDDRAREQRRIEAARAELATRERQLAQQVSSALIERGWQRVRGALIQRWNDPAARAAWLRTAVDEALDVLPRAAWRIAHPPEFEAGELAALTARVAEATGAAPELVRDASVAAGVRVSAGGATFDATLDGLLAKRADVEARLLLELERAGGGA